MSRMDNQYLSLFPFSFLVFISLFMATTLIIIRKKPKIHNSSRPKLPPGPPKLPLIGNLHLLIGTLPHHRLRDLAKKHGPLMHLQLGQLPVVVVSSAEAATQVMQTHDVNFANRPYSLAASFFSYNYSDIVFASYGDHWRQLRKLCTLELLSMKRVQSFRAVREEEVADFIRQISSSAGSPVNLKKRLWSLTYGIISRAALGVKYKEKDDFTLLACESLVVLSGFSLTDVFPSLKSLHVISGATSKLKKLHQNMDMILQNIVNEHRAKRETSSKNAKKETDNIVDVLLNLQDQGDLGFPLTDTIIKAVIWDIFIAGGESSATTIEWAISEMLKNPRVFTKAQREVRQLFGTKGDVNENSLEDLKYLTLVIKETLRLHPPGPLLAPRECRESCEINGYGIPAKTKVVVNAWAIGRDPSYWLEADRFYPERFLNSSIDFKGANFEFIPFGAGRRMCPGMSFGVLTLELILAQLLYHFDWKFHDGRKLEDIDMTEAFGLSVTRKHDLCLVPIPYNIPM